MFAIASDKPANNPVFALIIGVSDYTAYDPSGARDLPGAITDADSWADYCRHSLCLDNQHLLKLSDADGAVATERSSIIHGLQWLGEQLGKQEGVNDASALLTFSGHGLTFEHTGNDNIAEGLSLALAPSDIEAGFEAALLFSHIEEILFKAAAAARFGDADTLTDAQSAEVYAILENITAVFDACYSRPSGSIATVRALSEGPVPQLPQLKVFSRLVLGAHLWQTAYEIQTAGVWHGAFSYALVTMLDQWRVQSDAQTPVWYVHAAYGDIVFRARSLLTTLGMPDQTPTLLGTQNNLALVPFLRPGKAVNPDWTSVEPDGPKTREEFSTENTSGIIIDVSTKKNGKFYIIAYAKIETGAESSTTSWYWNANNAKSYTGAGYKWYLKGVAGSATPPSGCTLVGSDASDYDWTTPTLTNSGPGISAVMGTKSSPDWAVQLQWDTSSGECEQITTFAPGTPSDSGVSVSTFSSVAAVTVSVNTTGWQVVGLSS